MFREQDFPLHFEFWGVFSTKKDYPPQKKYIQFQLQFFLFLLGVGIFISKVFQLKPFEKKN